MPTSSHDTMLENPDQVWSVFTWYSSESWSRKRIWSSFIDVHIYEHGYIIPKEILVAKGNKIRNISLLHTIWINIQFVSQTHHGIRHKRTQVLTPCPWETTCNPCNLVSIPRKAWWPLSWRTTSYSLKGISQWFCWLSNKIIFVYLSYWSSPCSNNILRRGSCVVVYISSWKRQSKWCKSIGKHVG